MSQNTADTCSSDEKNCPLQPKFEGPPAPGAKNVKLTQEKYVQLLVEARETDPGCWPPGLEGAAIMLQRAQEIEDACIAKHGDFDPEKLSKKAQNEYFQIHLALDDLQDGVPLPEAQADAAQAVSQVAVSIEADKSKTDNGVLTPSEALALPAWPEFAPETRPDNFA